MSLPPPIIVWMLQDQAGHAWRAVLAAGQADVAIILQRDGLAQDAAQCPDERAARAVAQQWLTGLNEGRGRARDHQD